MGRIRLPYFGLFCMALFFFAVIFADVISPYPPNEGDLFNTTLPPAWSEDGGMEHILGTDMLGRDVLSRIIHGSRMSLIISVGCILFYGTLGVTLGLLSGFLGGRTDMIIMRVADLWLSLPGIIVLFMLASVYGPSAKTIIITFGIMGWPNYARIVRGECLSLKERDFVRLARVAGCSNLRIMFSHILPNIVNTIIIISTIEIGGIIVLTASMSFLGLGTQPPSCDWGLMLAEGRQYITYAWWLVTFPGVAIVIAVLGFNLTGDWLREVLDPKQKLR
ncbi:binding-protein-dependent transport systems inner membrane component [Desulfatibacillum aliphaticivorans]|uniref:Binding-protein-dependent transport systems inner membrane component n=2 Tax=Desulfatibacillum aliphaticivorans TaxID=218208 RepID=B8F8U0_DESAL|nr:binding-protein-dependent transport systems inner membrane component [Desulfatibacillum aliphaticivorans]